jgi:hypothetical protein
MDDSPVAERATAASQAENQARATESGLVEEAARVATTLNDKLPTLAPETPAATSGNHRGARDATREPQAQEENTGTTQTSGSDDGMTESALVGAMPEQAETRGRMRQRAASVGTSVGENLRPRVEKLREASIVMFDEASDDPGLRFVIIAVALFLLFLLFLLFSYILG